MSDADKATYIHGTNPEEQRRLSALNDLLNARWLAEVAPAPLGRILDFGSGLGQFSRALARAVLPCGGQAGAPRVVGIEFSPAQIQEAVRLARQAGEEHLVEFRQGDAGDPPLRQEEQGTFDLAHARFVLEHVTDPLRVVQAMVRAVRPGGRIVLADDDHEVLRLHPEPPALARVWSAYMRLYEVTGRDPLVGRKLVSLLRAGGARPVRNSWVWFGACSGNGEFEPIVWNMMHILEGAAEAMLRHGLVSNELLREALEGLEAFSKREDGAVWFAMAMAEAVRPPEE